jgi:hypothetical protein
MLYSVLAKKILKKTSAITLKWCSPCVVGLVDNFLKKNKNIKIAIDTNFLQAAAAELNIKNPYNAFCCKKLRQRQ